MKVSVFCVGRLGGAPEARLASDYAVRATKAGRGQGLGPVDIVEIEPRERGNHPQAEAILARLGGGSLIACDERGEAMSSRDFAGLLARLRDCGVKAVAFAIGGADGLDPRVLGAARQCLSFGPATWPHALARVMIAEQIYRAATILAGGPYHRD
ncbi:MAG: 23S rRNA (pseudouridine(1915)-N(3))-methyltransferase RlmH [Caulobacteraceae bacterium]